MEVLLAAPGTGKTTKIKSIIDEGYGAASNILVLSFTNATINDLTEKFKDYGNVNCYTLHKYALIVNHLPENHVLSNIEVQLLIKFSEKLNIDFIQLCEQLGCMSFDSMINSSINFIRANPAYAEKKIGVIDLLVIDEFQDFNGIERNLLTLLFEFASNTIILGDDDQSIYSFKDADPEALIAIFNDEANTKVKHEHICYRCPDEIVERCSLLISSNTLRVKKEWNKSNKAGELTVCQGWSQASINNYILQQINKIYQADNRESILILSSLKIASIPIIDVLERNGIEYVNFLNPDIDNKEYALIWWLRAIFGNHQLLNVIFLVTFNKLLSKVKLVEKFKDYFKDTQQFTDLIKLITSYKILSAPLSEYLLLRPEMNDFFKNHIEFNHLREFIDEDYISKSVDEIIRKISKPVEFDPAKVNIMTIHKSKGLQAENVFILGLTEGLLPNKSTGTDNLEAQRRLLYVGMTRAIKRLWLVSRIQWETKDIFGSKADRTQFKFNSRQSMIGKTSSFIDEMKLPVTKI